MMNCKRSLAGILALVSVLLGTGAFASASEQGSIDIALSETAVMVDGVAATEDPQGPVYMAHDILYYEDRDSYESGNPYGEGTAQERHTADEAAAHTVVHITEPGTYRLSGSLHGQVAIDLGKEAKRDEQAVVTLLLDGVDITCNVAPGVIFYNVFECDTDWVAFDEEETTEYNASPSVDTTKAGARVILAEGSVNTVQGSHVARIYKDEEGQKKKAKYDGAFYSRMSLTIDGPGLLNIVGDREGLDSELHLTLNGGTVNIASQDDGINTNEDLVSVTTINGGRLHVQGGLGTEGDGIDSNGYLVINGGTLICSANPAADCGMDSDLGTFINGGYVASTGFAKYWADDGCGQPTMNLQFDQLQDAGEAIIVTDPEGKVVFAVEPTRPYLGAVISCPEFEIGSDYQVLMGGAVAGDQKDGLFDTQTVTGFTDALPQTWQGHQLSTASEEEPDNSAAEPLSTFTLTDIVNAFASMKDAA